VKPPPLTVEKPAPPPIAVQKPAPPVPAVEKPAAAAVEPARPQAECEIKPVMSDDDLRACGVRR